jgi:DNA polymerase delta subunit 4
MPPKRRTSGPASKSQQSTLAFHGASNKVTKPGARALNAKKNLLTKPPKKDEKPAVTDVLVKTEDEPTTAEAAIIDQTELVQQQTQRTPEEEEASRITKKRIETYWKTESADIGAARAHQEELSLEEKILRKFDMTGQFGVSRLLVLFLRSPHWRYAACDMFSQVSEPQRNHSSQPAYIAILTEQQPCVGIARLKRWQRAHRLGLEPPIEVLAVLLKEQEGKDKLTVQRSHVDELLNSRGDAEVQA